MLAPPCQPYTRLGLKQDVDDKRSESFLTLLGEIREMQHPPRFVLIENVVGFDTSRMREELLETLKACGMHV